MTERMLPSARFIDADTAGLLAHITETAPVGHGLNYEDIIPSQFSEHDFVDGPQASLLNMMKPFVAAAVADYQEQTGRQADGIRRLDVMNQDPDAKSDSLTWHRDKLLPGENLYIASSGVFTEAAHGRDLLGFSRLPYRFPINALTDALISSQRLEIHAGGQGQTTVLTSGVVHRGGQDASKPRSSVSAAIYSRDYARSQLVNKKWEGRHLRRADRQDQYGF